MIALVKDQQEWGFACGRVGVLEGRMMGDDFFQNLVGLERNEDLFGRLQETPLREAMVPGAVTWEDWGGVIDAYYRDLADSIWGCSPARTKANVFMLRYDYLNLKRAIQNNGSYPFCMSLFSQDRLASVAGGNTFLLPDHLRPVVGMLAGAAAGGGDAENPLLIDITLDGAFLRHLLAAAKEFAIPLISACLDFRVLTSAVLALWRAVRLERPLRVYQQHFLPIGPYNGLLGDLIASGDARAWAGMLPGDVAPLYQQALEAPEDEQVIRFDRLAADHITALAKRAKLQTAGAERVFGFLWGLSVEMYNLKLAINGRLNKVDAELLRSRLRSCYV